VGEWLEGINSEEYAVPCPSCGTEHFLVFGEYGHFTTLDRMYMNKPDVVRIPLQPKQPRDLGPPGSRLHARALADGHADLADRLTYVFGSAHCADCDARFGFGEVAGCAGVMRDDGGFGVECGDPLVPQQEVA
jgi:hypothetical protein